MKLNSSIVLVDQTQTLIKTSFIMKMKSFVYKPTVATNVWQNQIMLTGTLNSVFVKVCTFFCNFFDHSLFEISVNWELMSFRNYCNAHQLRTVFGFYMVRFLLQRGFKQILVLGFFWMKLCTLITLNAYFNSLRGGGKRLLANSTFLRGQAKTSSSKEDGTLCISSWQMEVIGWVTGWTSTEATFQRCSYKKVFWINTANLQENTHVEVWFW